MNQELAEKLPELPAGYYWNIKDNRLAEYSIISNLVSPIIVELIRSRWGLFRSVVQEEGCPKTMEAITNAATRLYAKEFPPEDRLQGVYR